MTNLLFLVLALQLPVNSGANYESVRQERRLIAVKTSEKITVDGKLTESAWANAPLAKDFIQSEPREGQPSAELSEVRVLYDSEYIYFGAYLHDSNAKRVVITDLKKDYSGDGGDNFEIVLDTFHDKRNGYIFWTNPGGAKGDSQMINEGRENNSSWDAVWYVKTSQLDDGWIAEIAIPFKTLKFREAEIQTWGINFHRNLRSNVRNEDSFWAPLPRIYGINRVSLAGTLDGLEGIKPGSNIRLKPYVTSSYAQNRISGLKKGDGDFGFDAKYGLTSGLTWDFTYNTDFSQVEADEQQINLTRFSLFFPEKREFFLENSGIFKFGGGDAGFGGGNAGRGASNEVFFFSRNIGLSSRNEAVPILGGTRLTGRTGAYEIGALNMQQREYNDSKATNFTVGRLKRNILANSDIGVMVMNKEVTDSPLFNRVVGTDANLRFGQDFTINAFAAKSSTPGVNSGDMYGRFAVGYQNRTWTFRNSYTDIQENFNNQMGYFPRRGIRRYNHETRYAYRFQNNSIVRFVQPHLTVDYIEDQNGNFDSKYLDYHFPITFQNGSWIEIGKSPSVEVLKKPFSLNNGRTIVPAGTYDNPEFLIVGRLDQSRRIFPTGNIRIGPFFGGYKHNYNIGSTFRVNYKLNVMLNYTHNNISLPVQNGRFKTNLLATRLNYSFSTSVFLNALVQYNSDARQWSSNIRFNVIHRPLSDFFLVYNERRDSITGELADRAIIAKLTYMISK